MALRDQPYIPLYIQDIMTDEKLNECSAATHGIYIKGIMCLMHKSETYGKILLKQKYKQTESKEQSKGYALACQLDRHLPYTQNEIYSAIQDLVREGVCYFEGDYLCQKRMIKDNDISLKRSRSGKKGGKKTQSKPKFAKAKEEASSEYENEIENEIENENSSESTQKVKEEILSSQVWIEQICIKKKVDEKYLKMDLVKFLDDLDLKNELDKPIGDIKSHFINWLNIQLKNGKNAGNTRNTSKSPKRQGTGERKDFTDS